MSNPEVEAAPDKLCLRIYPPNKTKGHTRETFIVHGHPTTFRASSGWYELDAKIAKQLAKFRNNPQDPTSPRIFQVVTREEAERIDARGLARPAADARNPIRVATNPIQSRNEVPKPVIFDTPAPTAPAAAPPAPTLVEKIQATIPDLVDTDSDDDPVVIADDFDDAFGEDEVPAPTGAMTTADLDPDAGTAKKPHRVEVDSDEADEPAIPKPVDIPAPARKTAGSAKKKR